MPDLGLAAGRLDGPDRLLEDLALPADGRVVGFVGVREVRPHPDDPDGALGLVEAGRGDEVEEVLPVGAVAPEAGVGLEVDPGGPAGDAGGGDDVVEGPGG